MEALLEHVPDRIETDRLILRCPRADDGPALNAAVCGSLAEMRRWLIWAQTAPSMAQSEAECRRMQAKFLLRQDLVLFIFERNVDGSEGELIGGTGLHRIDWTVRRFEIGYWCRSSRVGRGFITEAVEALTDVAFRTLNARRVEIRMDDTNVASWKVAERAAFTLEGVLRSEALNLEGAPRDTRIYARTGERVNVSGPTSSDDAGPGISAVNAP